MADPKRRKLQNTDDISENSDMESITSECGTSDTYFDIINIDCIERIFDFLSPIDLLNAAELNANTAKAAEIVYARRYSNLEVEIYISAYEYVREMHEYKPIIAKNSSIHIHSAVVCSIFVERFGNLFEKLALRDRVIDDTPLTEDWHEALQMIQKKCGKDLKVLILFDNNKRTTKIFQTPFEAVEKLSVDGSFSLGKFTGLNEWFPSLKKLCISHFRPRNPRIPSNLKLMIQTAPQLEELELQRQFGWHSDSSVNASDLHFINECQPNLKHLKFDWIRDSENESINEVSFKHVESCRIRLMNLSTLENVPLKFEQLKDLTMIYDGQWPYSGIAMDCINFAAKQIGLTKLNLQVRCKLSTIQLSKLASRLTKLTELKLLAILDFNALDYILSHFKSLHTLIVFYPGKEIHELCSKFSTRWIMGKNMYSMILKRK